MNKNDLELFDEVFNESSENNNVMEEAQELVLTESEFYSTLNRFKQQMFESIELIEMMEQGKIVPEATEDEQDTYTEQMIFESYCDGPYYEKVNAANKEEIKRIAKQIRDKFLSRTFKKSDTSGGWIKGDKINGDTVTKNKLIRFTVSITSFVKGWGRIPNIIMWLVPALASFFNVWVLDPKIISKFNNSRLKLYAWQTICYLLPGRKITFNELLDKMNNYFKDELGDKYELNVVKMKFFIATLRGKKELTEDEKNSPAKCFACYLLIVNEKGTPISNKEEEIKVEGKNAEEIKNALDALNDIEPPSSEASMKDKVKQLIDKVKSKFSKKDESDE